jgi:hypothetical protein
MSRTSLRLKSAMHARAFIQIDALEPRVVQAPPQGTFRCFQFSTERTISYSRTLESSLPGSTRKELRSTSLNFPIWALFPMSEAQAAVAKLAGLINGK